MTRQELRNLARRAHLDNVPFADFWPTVAEEVRKQEPWNAARFRRLHGQLLQIVLTGELSGQFPPGDCDGLDPWLVDAAEESKPHDTRTQARYQGELFDVRPQYR